MTKHTPNKLEQRIKFVTRYYVPEGLNTDRAWEKFRTMQGIGTHKKPIGLWIGIAASLLLLIGSGTWLLNTRLLHDWQDYRADNGKPEEVWLPDSTQITLSPGATIRFDRKTYGAEARDIRLKGKAFFDVRRNPAAPFSVKTAIARITVLGTSFQVDDQPKEVSVNVITGKVCFEIPREEEAAVLTAGMSGSYHQNSQTIEVTEEETRNRIAWKTKELHFRDTPLPEVIATLEAYYNCRIEYASPSKKEADSKLKLTATLRDISLREALNIIHQTLGVRLKTKPITSPKH
ncbi:MAG: FecR domain-containing protein [Bacteroidales bacterium]